MAASQLKLYKVKPAIIKLYKKNSLRRNWMPEQLSGLCFHATSTPLWLLKPAKVSTSFELYPNLFWLHNLLDFSSIQCFDSPLSQHIQLDYLWLPTPYCAALVWLTGRYTTPLVTRCFPANPYAEKQIHTSAHMPYLFLTKRVTYGRSY